MPVKQPKGFPETQDVNMYYTQSVHVCVLGPQRFFYMFCSGSSTLFPEADRRIMEVVYVSSSIICLHILEIPLNNPVAELVTV